MLAPYGSVATSFFQGRKLALRYSTIVVADVEIETSQRRTVRLCLKQPSRRLPSCQRGPSGWRAVVWPASANAREMIVSQRQDRPAGPSLSPVSLRRPPPLAALETPVADAAYFTHIGAEEATVRPAGRYVMSCVLDSTLCCWTYASAVDVLARLPPAATDTQPCLASTP